MIGGLRVLGIVPARGGSKGVQNKNIREVGGKPLLAWTLAAASASRYLDRTIVSSEDTEIIRVARECGGDVPFARPSELARDDTPGIDPVLHAIRELPGFDCIVLLQPTSPLRLPEDIDRCLELLRDAGAPTCVSVTEASDHPYWTYQLDPSGRLKPFIELAPGSAQRRQDLPRALTVNGAVYAARVPWLMEHRRFVAEDTVAYEMPSSRSLDIDTPADLEQAQQALQAR